MRNKKASATKYVALTTTKRKYTTHILPTDRREFIRALFGGAGICALMYAATALVLVVA